MNQDKWQELKDAVAHAKHNGGRVSVECGDLDELLNTWRAANTAPEVQPEQPALQPIQASESAPPAEPNAGGIPIPPAEPVAQTPEADPETAPAVPEPTIQ